MIIVPTRICDPCNCTYCNVLKAEFNQNFWDKIRQSDKLFDEVFFQIIFILVVNNDSTIRFFGGEPLIKKDFIFAFIVNFKKKLKEKKLVDFLNKLKKSDKSLNNQTLNNLLNGKIEFIINSNLKRLTDSEIKFIKQQDIKIITSYNGNNKFHSLTRGISLDDSVLLEENIKTILDQGISLQANIVLFPNKFNEFTKAFDRLEKFGVNEINIIPLGYDNTLDKSEIDICLDKFDSFIKKNNKSIISNFKLVENELPLFEGNIVLDYDGNIYCSMLIIEKFFDEYKNITQMGELNNESYIDIKSKLDSNNYAAIINKYLLSEYSQELSFSDKILVTNLKDKYYLTNYFSNKFSEIIESNKTY